jgi:Family of unknown function (DUF6064)
MGHAMPFTAEQFFEVFASYNAAVWPMQVFAYLAGIAAVALVFRASRLSTGLVLALLALMWIVNSVGYHWAFFADINRAARIFGAVFAVQAVLLLATAFVAPSFRIAAAKDARTWFGLSLAAYALAIYPVLGRFAGHSYPAVPVFGIAPCPTAIFTIGLLLLGSWRTARWLLLIPGLWGVVGGSAAILLGVPQDYGLIAALLVAIGFALAGRAGFARHEVGTA